MKEGKSMGNIDRITCNITKPVNMEALDVSFNQLTVLVGQNGSGKSLAMIIVYCLGYISSAIVINKTLFKSVLIELSQFVFDHCFNDQNFDGVISGYFASGTHISITFKDGKVIDFDHYVPDDVTIPTPVVYMSSNLRTFNSVKSYLTVRKVIADAKNTAGELLTLEMLKTYKLYDVTYMEKFIASCPILVKPDIAETLKRDYDFKDTLLEIKLDVDKSDFYYTCREKPDERKYLTTLSNGEQALLNMIITASI